MIIGIPVYNDVDTLDVASPYEMFRWPSSTSSWWANARACCDFATAFVSR
jgi:hypothetical protein